MEATLRIAESNELTDEQQQIVNYLMERLGMTQEEAQDTIFSTELEEAPEPVKKFHITDANSANWLLKRIAETNAEISTVHKMLDDEVDRLRRRTETILQPLQRKLDFFTNNFAAELEAWTKKELEGKRERSKKLLYGKVGIKTGSVSTELLTSEDEIISIIECLPVYDPFAEEDYYPGRELYELNEKLQGAIKVSKSILKSPLKSALEDGWDGTLGVNGQKVSIARVKKSDDSFYFETELPK